jgi:hypothetical protein
MAIFGLGRSASGLGGKARLVPGDGSEVAARLIVAANRQDWEGARAILAAHSGGELSVLLNQLTRHGVGACDWLRGRHREEESDPLAWLVLGAATVSHAWKVRTAARAQHVSRGQFAEFHELLRAAEDYLYRAIELDPAESASWSQLVTSGRGLEVGPDIIRRRFDAVVARCPDHRHAHEQMLQCLCEKWSGSHEQMHAFADKALTGPHHAMLAHLIPIAHLEHWLSLGVGLERSAYMQGKAVRAQLEEAADLSIFQPERTVPLSPYYDANLFAMALSLAGLDSEARRAFVLTDGVVTKFPWEYGNGRDPVTFYSLRRDKARKAPPSAPRPYRRR